MAISPIEALFRKSDIYKEFLADFEANAQERLAAIKDEYDKAVAVALSAALGGDVQVAPKPAAKKTVAAKPAGKPLAAVPDPEPELAPAVEDVDDQAWVVEPDDADEAQSAETLDLSEGDDGVWADDGEPDEY